MQTKQISLFKNRNAGFTLIEMLLSVAVITLIAGTSAPVYQSFQVRNDLDIVTVSTVHSLRRAQVLSQSIEGDTSWGVKTQSGSLILFKGTSFAGRDTMFDELFSIPTSITPSGVSEIVFDKLTGFPQTTGTITFTSNANETKTITINAKGMVNY